MMAAKKLDGVGRVSRVGERGGDESYGSPEIQREAMERWVEHQQVDRFSAHRFQERFAEVLRSHGAL